MATLTLSEDAITRLIPDDDALRAARLLLREKRFSDIGISPDATWLLGQCQGSGSTAYQVSVDLSDPSSPKCRCSCPSRKQPCKHGLGLLLLYTQQPEGFRRREPSPPPLAVEEKKTNSAANGDAANGDAAKPRKVNQAALLKKLQAQRDGLDLLEKLLIDIVSGGQWYEQTHLDRLGEQAKQLGDAYLPGAMHALNTLIVTAGNETLSDDERLAVAADLIGHLWATVKKGRTYFDDKLAGDEDHVCNDPVMEIVLGRNWQMAELREKGHVKTNMTLLELAFERHDHQGRQQRVETSHLLELSEGAVYQAIAFRPFKGMRHVPEQPSYAHPLLVKDAVVYPGFHNRRIRWEKEAEQVEDLTPGLLQKAYQEARPDFQEAVDVLRRQMKHALAPHQVVVLLRCERIGRADNTVMMEDAAGVRLEAVEGVPESGCLDNFIRAMGMLGRDRPAVLARLSLVPARNAIVAQPLAALTPRHHLRLGM
jgi:hypothetical protein